MSDLGENESQSKAVLIPIQETVEGQSQATSPNGLRGQETTSSDGNEVRPPSNATSIDFRELFILQVPTHEIYEKAMEDELTTSLLEGQGGIVPLHVHKVGDRFAIIDDDGKSAFLAIEDIMMMGFSSGRLEEKRMILQRFHFLPCIVHEGLEGYEHALEDRISLVVDRRTPPLAKAVAVRELIRYSGSLAEASRKSNLRKSTLSQLDSLNDLDPRVQEMVTGGGTSVLSKLSVLIELARVQRGRQFKVAQLIVSQNGTAKQAMKIIKSEKGRGPISGDDVPVTASDNPLPVESLAEKGEE